MGSESSSRLPFPTALLVAVFALTTMLVVAQYAQVPESPVEDTDPKCDPTLCQPGRDLVEVPEIRSENGLLQGVIVLDDEPRWVAQPAEDDSCCEEHLRYFRGYSTQEPIQPWPSTGDPIPGPTLRARVGDLVQLTFLNQIDPLEFAKSLDQGERGESGPCDQAFGVRKNAPDEPSVQIYPRNESPDAKKDHPGDTYPNCFHGSSTANIHFHGTHTTPSTTGDNVLLFIRPALRDKAGKLHPEDGFVEQQFAEFFEWCTTHGPPSRWEEMPKAWQEKQKELLQIYDATAPYKSENGKLPEEMWLWPKNEKRLRDGLWPQYSIGAFPYCFPLPSYDPSKVEMGQAPGTHWYHAHKHGSTALNVGNGMTGAFVIEGEYDDALREFYEETPEHKNWALEERVLVIQQLEASLNVLSPGSPNDDPPVEHPAPGEPGPAPLSVNGRLNPVVTMRPDQVQLWRVVNTAPRSAVQFHGFTSESPADQSPAWRQIAQDGVQLSFANYQRVGTVNARFNLAAANRADLLVKAPAIEGDFALHVVKSVNDLPSGTPTTLLTVRVRASGDAIDPPMDFIEKEEDFPKLPAFLADISGPVHVRRELWFNTKPKAGRKRQGLMPLHEINDKLFDGEHVDQAMAQGAAEEWTMFNQTTNIAHPFHIHINPFQVVEVFQPNLPAVQDKTGPCYADPLKPETWKPCDALKLQAPYVWWDVFAVPTARKDRIDPSVCTKLDQCPTEIRRFASCAKDVCSVTIPGYFRMRSRFVDFPGQFVLHCHILAHEDRGMMELVEVVGKTPYEHH